MDILKPAVYNSAPLEYASNSIRLIEIIPTWNKWKCQFHTVRLEDGQPFIALSYAWGSTAASRSINLAGHDFPIRANLYNALQSIVQQKAKLKTLLGGHKLLFWIDALCINQRNMQERNHQVHLMSRIYSEASLVLVWLGENADNSSLAFNDIMTGHAMITEQTVRALISLLSRPYWKRMWIVQEIILAQSIYLLCGHDTVSWTALLSYIRVFLEEEDKNMQLATLEEFSDYMSEGSNIFKTSATGRRGAFATHDFLDFKFQLIRANFNADLDYLKAALEQTPGYDTIRAKSLWSKEYSRLDKAILRWSQRECDDPRDKIFALLGITGIAMGADWDDIEADYDKSVESLYKDVLLGTLCSENIYVKLGYGKFLEQYERVHLASRLADILGVNTERADVKQTISEFTAGWRRKSVGYYDASALLGKRTISDEVYKLTYVRNIDVLPQQPMVPIVSSEWTWKQGERFTPMLEIDELADDVPPDQPV